MHLCVAARRSRQEGGARKKEEKKKKESCGRNELCSEVTSCRTRPVAAQLFMALTESVFAVMMHLERNEIKKYIFLASFE